MPLAVLGADLASHPVILQETEEQKPVADETAGDSADISKAQEVSDASQEAIDKMNQQAQETIDDATGWLDENPWCIGIIYVVFGPLIAFFGAKWFPYITATLSALFVTSFIYLVCDSAGWLESTGAQIGTLCGALVAGIIVGCVVRRNFKFMLGLLGLVAGFFGGSLVFALISGMTGGEWNAVWGYWVISVACAVIGCVLAIYLGMPVVMLSTALVGSYLFMRSWTLFFPGNYPSEQELIDSKG